MSHSDASQFAQYGVGFFAIFFIFAMAATVFGIWMWWRILEKAGYSGALSLLLLTGIGGLILQIVLAFSRWPIEDQMDAMRARYPTP